MDHTSEEERSLWRSPSSAQLLAEPGSTDFMPPDRVLVSPRRTWHLSWLMLAVLVLTSLLLAWASSANWRRATVLSQPMQQLRPQQLWLPDIRFQMIRYGDCKSVGWVTITTKKACEQASKHLGLSDHTVSVTAEVPRPFGCYFFQNAEDHTSSLWLSINETNVDTAASGGAMSGKHWQRQLICQAQEVQIPTSTSPTETVTTTRSSTTTSSSHTALNAKMILQAALDQVALGLRHTNDGPHVPSLGSAAVILDASPAEGLGTS